jgi:ribosomal protein L33
MSQDLMRTLQTKGPGKGHTYNARFNNKNKKDPSAKLTLKKFNKITRQHEEYKQKK